jgi:hypothetical protein
MVRVSANAVDAEKPAQYPIAARREWRKIKNADCRMAVLPKVVGYAADSGREFS